MSEPQSLGAPAVSSTQVFSLREPLADYLARTDYTSATTLRRLARPDESRGFEGAHLGNALHAYLLEPETFESTYLSLDGTVPAGRSLSDAEAHAREWLTPAQMDGLRWAREAIEGYGQDPLARWLHEGDKELSIYWTGEQGGRWKARPDCFTRDVILELKTTTDVRPEAFARTRQRLGYDIQAAHYLEAVERLTGESPRFVFVTLELVPTRSLWLHELSSWDLLDAKRMLAELRERYLREAPRP